MKAYYQLIKPGIVYGNALPALAAFLYASHGRPSATIGVTMLVGLSLVVASSCVFNNVIDRDIDGCMARTKERAMVRGTVPVKHALIYASLLGVLGFLTLAFFTNALTVATAAFGMVAYVLFYTPAKRRTPYSTIIGALSGAVPPVVGYVSVVDRLDSIALLLFLALITWQMVHFFAIAIFRVEEYRAAGLPVMPLSVGIPRTKILMIVYAILFTVTIAVLHHAARLGPVFLSVMLVLSVAWVVLGRFGMQAKDDARWARTMFFYSLAVLLAFSFTLAFPLGA